MTNLPQVRNISPVRQQPGQRKPLHPNQEARCKMTTKPNIQAAGRFRLPDPPRREPDEVTAFDHIYKYANHLYLAKHFGSPESTLVEYDRWIVAFPDDNRARARRPDLLIAFHVSPEDYEASNGYIISEQGKPPDFVMEVASQSTADVDTGAKREDYAALGIPEYWRFDETGDHHKTKLAGDILEGEAYRPIHIHEVAPDILQGYSPALNLIIRWDHGTLAWWDPVTEAPLATYEDQEARADRAETRARELEEEIRRLRGEASP